MKFKYKLTPFGVYMPIVPIGVGKDSIVTQYAALVDSGAAVNIMDAQIAEVIGLDLKSGKKGSIEVLQGQKMPAYIHDVLIELDSERFTAPVYFMENCVWPYGILGQKGFFNKFHVHFDQRKGSIDINPQKDVN